MEVRLAGRGGARPESREPRRQTGKVEMESQRGELRIMDEKLPLAKEKRCAKRRQFLCGAVFPADFGTSATLLASAPTAQS